MASSVPGTVSYLITLFTGVLPTGSQVWLGQAVPKFTAPVSLQITGVANGVQEPAELGPDFMREETYNVLCELYSWAGGIDFQSRMTEVYTNFELVTIAVGNDFNLGDNVRFAEIGDFQFTPESDNKGNSLGCIAFDIRCAARITSLT